MKLAAVSLKIITTGVYLKFDVINRNGGEIRDCLRLVYRSKTVGCHLTDKEAIEILKRDVERIGCQVKPDSIKVVGRNQEVMLKLKTCLPSFETELVQRKKESLQLKGFFCFFSDKR